MASEIKIALNDGTLSKREGIVMPSAIMSPWRPSFAVELPKETIKAFWYAARHEGCDLSIVESVGNDIDAFEMITRNFAVTDISEQELRLAGWVVSYDDKIDIELAVTRQDNQLIILDKRGGEDVYESFRNSGRVLENAHNCRFDQTVTCNNEEELWLCVLKNGKEIDRFPLNEETRHEERSNYTWYIDDISLTPREKSVLEIGANKRIVFLQWINRIYQRCGGIIAVIGLGCYFFLTLQLFARGLLKKNWQLFDSWLMCSSFLGSTIVLCVGIAYTQISSFTAISSVYLASGYILVTIFSVLSIIVIFREVKKSLNQKRQRKKKRFTYEDF